MRIFAIAAALIAATAVPVLADSTFVPDDNELYRVTSDYVGFMSSLDVLSNDAGNRVHLDGTTNSPTQLWHIHQSGDGSYTVSTGFNGSCRRLDLAIHPGGTTQVLLNAPNSDQTQHWFITGGQGSNHWRFANRGIPLDQSMDTVNPRNDFILQMAPELATASQYYEITGVSRFNNDGRCDV